MTHRAPTANLRAVLFDLDETLIVEEESVVATFRNVCSPVAVAIGEDPGEIGEVVRKEARALFVEL